MSDVVVFDNADQARLQVANRLAADTPGLTRTLGGTEVADGLTTNQLGAVLSLYDNSPGLVVGSSLAKAIQAGDMDAALHEIVANSNGGANKSGVQIRRDEEGALFGNPVPVSGDCPSRSSLVNAESLFR